jgi:hypothetical protein
VPTGPDISEKRIPGEGEGASTQPPFIHLYTLRLFLADRPGKLE